MTRNARIVVLSLGILLAQGVAGCISEPPVPGEAAHAQETPAPDAPNQLPPGGTVTPPPREDPPGERTPSPGSSRAPERIAGHFRSVGPTGRWDIHFLENNAMRATFSAEGVSEDHAATFDPQRQILRIPAFGYEGYVQLVDANTITISQGAMGSTWGMLRVLPDGSVHGIARFVQGSFINNGPNHDSRLVLYADGRFSYESSWANSMAEAYGAESDEGFYDLHEGFIQRNTGPVTILVIDANTVQMGSSYFYRS